MALFTTNYKDLDTNSNEPLPAGIYEVLIQNVQEQATKSGAENINFNLVVRNDLDEAMPDTNGKCHNRHVWHSEWKRRATGQYEVKNLMRYLDAVGVPEGTAIESMDQFFDMLTGKPVRIEIGIEDNEYQGKITKRNVIKPWDWSKTKFPQVQHVLKNDDKKPIFKTPAPSNEGLPF